MKIVFQDPTFSLQLFRAISEIYYKGDIGECLSTACPDPEMEASDRVLEWLMPNLD
jgi:hypothetical protein